MVQNSKDEQFPILSDLKKVGRYEIVRKLGQGNTGLVLLGKDPYIKRQVALKVSPLAASGVSEKFFKEIQSAGRLTHPNLVAVYDAGLSRDYCYIAMEYIDGPVLSDFCKKDNLMPMTNAAQCVYDVAKALGYAHEKGIIHCDLKPSNIMLENGKTPKITDFGIARIAEGTAPTDQYGTPGYMSPEQLKNEKACPQSDIFALGCVFYEVLTGAKAFDGDSYFSIMYKVINDEPAPAQSLNPEIPLIFDRILQKAMAKKLKDRYKSCEEFAFELSVALRGLSGLSGPSGPVRPEKINDVIDYVCGVSFFSEFSKRHVRELLSASQMMQVKKDEYIVDEGEIDDSFYIVLSGKTKVIRNNKKVAVIKIGECFGEMAYIGGRPRSATVIAEEDCVLMKINGTLLDRAPATIQLLFFKKFAQTLVDRLVRSGLGAEGKFESVV